MHHKAEIRKQLKIRYLNWHRLAKKEKKAVAKKVLNEVVANYDFKQEVTTPVGQRSARRMLPISRFIDHEPDLFRKDTFVKRGRCRKSLDRAVDFCLVKRGEK